MKKRLTHLRANTYKDADNRHSHGRWKREIEGRSVANDQGTSECSGKMKTQNQRCKVVWHANMASMSVMVENTKGVETS